MAPLINLHQRSRGWKCNLHCVRFNQRCICFRCSLYVSGGETFDGFIQDVRIYKGVAKYTSDFVVPSTSPDILPDTPSGVSGSSKLTKITDGAVSFDASGDNLSLATSTDLSFGTGDFTIEAYAYLNGYRPLICFQR